MPIERIAVDPPKLVWVRVWKNSWELNAEWPGLLHEWEGRGPAGLKQWTGRVTLTVDDPPPAWDPKRPWVPAERIRRRDL